MMDNDKKEKPKKNRHIMLWVILLEMAVLTVGVSYLILTREDKDVDSLLEQNLTISYVDETKADASSSNPVPQPAVDEQILTKNKYSRPGKKVDAINYIVIHYLANPQTTAQQNHDYFESLKDLKDVSMSANYVIGLEGEIIQCVPDGEVAYASNSMNSQSISIENCHMDASGKFTEATYNSLVKLTAYLTEEYGLDRDHIIRHYDVTGKDCPKYYVEHEDKWEEFKDDVMAYREECESEYEATMTEPQTEVDLLAVYLESNLNEETEGGESGLETLLNSVLP